MLTEKQIKFLDEIAPDRWVLRDNEIDISGGVGLGYYYKNNHDNNLFVKFGIIEKDFNCERCNLTSLKNSPRQINSCFYASYNNLTNLIDGPLIVDGNYIVQDNKLTSLKGAPNKVHSFFCDNNNLSSLEGCPVNIKYWLCCLNNPNLEYLWGIGNVKDKVHYNNENEINEWIIQCGRLNKIFPFFTLEENIKWIKNTQSYSYLLNSPDEIRTHFSPRILHLVDTGTCLN